ncbi:MAG: hypothetical protein ABW184_04665 [Sphingobium sp.]
MTKMKPGTKLKSTVCDTEVMVIKSGEGSIEAGGAPMAEAKPAELGTLSADFSGGTLMGKRYVDADGKFELLCVKPGKGSLSVDGTALSIKDAKPLPASD